MKRITITDTKTGEVHQDLLTDGVIAFLDGYYEKETDEDQAADASALVVMRSSAMDIVRLMAHGCDAIIEQQAAAEGIESAELAMIFSTFLVLAGKHSKIETAEQFQKFQREVPEWLS